MVQYGDSVRLVEDGREGVVTYCYYYTRALSCGCCAETDYEADPYQVDVKLIGGEEITVDVDAVIVI